MASNRGVVYLGPGKVEVQSIDYPKMQNPKGKAIEHGAILKIVSTNICGSDQHMVRGRTTAPSGLVLGHEITGEVIEKGKDVEYLNVGDLVSVVGGQADYVLVPYADFNLLKFPDKDQAMAKIRDLTMLSDILPTGFHGAVSAGVGVGSTVYVAGAGPVGLAAAASARILGAAVVMIGDLNDERLKHAKAVGFEPIDLRKSDNLGDLIEQVIKTPEVDASVDAVGFEARGHGNEHVNEAPATVLNSLMTVTRAGGGIGIPGLYVTADPGSKDEAAQQGNLRMRFGLGWAKSHRFYTGQTPVLKYNRQLMQAILHDRLPIAKVVNATVVSLEEAPQGYQDFDKGAAKKYVLDPHGMIRKAA